MKKIIQIIDDETLPKNGNYKGNVVLKPWIKEVDTGVYQYYQTLNRYSEFLFSSIPKDKNYIINTHTHGIDKPYNVDVYTAHIYYNEEDFPSNDRLNSRIIANAKAAKIVIAVSEYLKDILVKNGVDEDKIRVIPAFVDYDWIQQNKERLRELWYKETGLKNFVLFVGRNHRQKRPELFIELAKKYPDMEFVMIGRGIPGLDTPRNVYKFDPVDHEMCLGAMANARVVVAPSKYESFGLVALESLAIGTPTIISDSGGHKELPIDTRFEPDDIESLCQVFEHVLEKGGQVGNEQISHYNAKIIAAEVDRIYREV